MDSVSSVGGFFQECCYIKRHLHGLWRVEFEACVRFLTHSYGVDLEVKNVTQSVSAITAPISEAFHPVVVGVSTAEIKSQTP